jgi:hypothetical protein
LVLAPSLLDTKPICAFCCPGEVESIGHKMRGNEGFGVGAQLLLWNGGREGREGWHIGSNGKGYGQFCFIFMAFLLTAFIPFIHIVGQNERKPAIFSREKQTTGTRKWEKQK